MTPFAPSSTLAPRLDADDALTLGVAVLEMPSLLEDPRMEESRWMAIYDGSSPRALLSWPDGALGYAFFREGQSVAQSVNAAYSTARAALEAVHLQDAAPAGPTH